MPPDLYRNKEKTQLIKLSFERQQAEVAAASADNEALAADMSCQCVSRSAPRACYNIAIVFKAVELKFFGNTYSSVNEHKARANQVESCYIIS